MKNILSLFKPVIMILAALSASLLISVLLLFVSNVLLVRKSSVWSQVYIFGELISLQHEKSQRNSVCPVCVS